MRHIATFMLMANLATAASFHVEVSGDSAKRAMILIPGLASSGEVWHDTVARYRDLYQCHVLTLAGFAGLPAEPATTRLLQRVVRDLAAHIAEHRLQSPVIVGHSLGGVIAMSLAAAHPKLVGDLIIIDSLPHLAAVFGPDYDPAPMRDRIAQQPRAEYEAFIRSGQSVQGMVTDPKHLARLIDWSLQSDQATVAQAIYELGTTNLTTDLAKIRSRTLVLGTWLGMKSFTTRDVVAGNFRKQYAGLAGHEFALSDTAQHFIMYDDPGWFYAQVDAFLSGRVRSGDGR